MQKSGMQFEGILRQGKKRNDGCFCDIAIYSILCDDWTVKKEQTILKIGGGI